MLRYWLGRACWLIGLTWVGVQFVVPVHAGVVSRLEAVDAAGLVWQPMQHMDIAAIPLHIKPFAATLPVARVAEALAANQDLFQRILVAPGLAILSGVHGNAHWLAEIWQEPGHSLGSAGRVSVLPFEGSQDLAVTGETTYSWLPLGAERIAQWQGGRAAGDVPVADSGRTAGGVQTVYRVPMTVGQLRDQLASRLRAQDWSPLASVPSGKGVTSWQAWQRHNERLFLYLQGTNQGTSLYIHHFR